MEPETQIKEVDVEIAEDTKVNPLSFKYIKVVRLFYDPLGVFPVERFGEKSRLRPLRFSYPAIVILFWSAEVVFVIRNYKTMDFFLIGHCYLTNVTTGMMVIRVAMYMMKTYDDIMEEYLKSFHIVHSRALSPYYEKLFNYEQKFSSMFAMAMMIFTCTGMLLYSSLPIYNNFHTGVFGREKGSNLTIDLSIYYYFPFYNPVEHVVSACILNFYLSYLCSFMTMVSDLVVYLMIFQIITHIYCLLDDLANIPKPKNFGKNSTFQHYDMIIPLAEMYDAQENAIIQGILGRCVHHHRIIVTFADKISSFFGPMLAYNYFYQVTSLCMQLIEISRGDFNTFVRYVFFTLLVFSELIFMSVIFEKVGSTSEQLIEAVYDVPWEYMSISNKRIVSVFLHRVQSPISITAIGMVPVGLGTMTGILKTTFSYFAFLRTLNS